MSTDVKKRSLGSELLASSGKRRRSVLPPQSTNKVNEDGIAQCFHKVSTSLYVSLAPIHLNDPINGIKAQHLDPLVMTYFPKAKGVVLAYSNIKLSSDNVSQDSHDKTISVAKIEGSSPFTFLWITVDFLVWRPQVGDVVEGYIYMQTASHLGLLIHDTFNASIKKYNIPSGWQFVPNQADEITDDTATKFKSFGYWMDENEVKVEGKIKFTIKSIHTTGKVVSVEGTLITPGSEREAQPVLRERRSSTSTAPATPGKHKRFDEVDEVVLEIPEPKDEDDLPTYAKEESDSDEADEDNVVVNKEESDSEDSS
ncbi:DNA-dependent RNA polymerase I subunit A43 [Scheffersomyces amazonensis]|uniref:DNA-dependent RNA polymerase I subunit A43 n=1 Tax=Scheffersomyces amazonensis TaxID=1078765 RepID=UPI00315D0233